MGSCRSSSAPSRLQNSAPTRRGNSSPPQLQPPALRKGITKGILILSHSQKQRALGYPCLHPSPLEANEFPWRPPAGARLSVRLCVGEGVYVSAHRSLVWL